MELINKIDEKELFAARSTADAAGNNIADTYAKKTEIPDVSDFVTQQELSTELNTKQDNLSTEQLYNIDNAVTSLAGVMTENKLTIEGGKITEYDGTPFAGQGGGEGGKTYEGVAPIIVDNDNNTISADTIDVNYQQIVHDDSLVHVSNNAQYALGVNVPYLKWLMGVDETVIFENPNGIDSTNPGELTIGTTYNLTEPFENFDRIRVYTHDKYNNTVDIVEWFTTPNRGINSYCVKAWFLYSDGGLYTRAARIIRAANTTNFKIEKYNDITISQATTAAVKNTNTASGDILCISRIVGVHRKEWNGGN